MGQPSAPTRWPVPAFAVMLACAGGMLACTGGGHASSRYHAPPSSARMLVAAAEESSAVGASRATRTLGKCDGPADIQRFTLAHFNDLQARYSDLIDGRSRYGFVAGYLRSLKAEIPETLVLDAGDDYEKGSVLELRSMGETTRRMVQALPIDVRTIGNHDFAYGAAAVMRDATLSAHPVLAANVQREDSSDNSPFAPFVRVDVGCVKVGIVGLVTGNYASNDFPTQEPFDGVFVQDDRYAEILSEAVREHRDEVDVMMSLDHLGLGQDIDLANRVPGVDVFVGGHSEDLLTAPYVVRRRDGSRSYVVQAGHYGLTLGRADLSFDTRDGTLTIDHYAIVKVDETLPFADDVGALARELEAAYAPDTERAIAVVAAPIPQGKPMADLVWRATQAEWGADALLLGKDVFWGGLPRGPLTLQHLYDAVLVQREPAGTTGFTSLYVMSVTGKELAALRARLVQGPLYAVYLPGVLDPERTYRVVVEKRALENPGFALVGGPPLPAARYGGELIDVLERYARNRTAHGLPIDIR